MRARTFASFLWLSALVAQTPQPALQLPTLLRLGSLPANAPTVTIDGSDGGAHLAALPAGTTAITVRADHRTSMQAVQAVFDEAMAKGLEKFFLLATLRDGTPGVLTLALPTATNAPTTVSLRAHRQRPGVPPESAIPLLRRLHDGWEQDGKGPFVLGITLPEDATYAHLLPLLAAAAEARIPSVVVRTSKADAVERASGSLAIDLESSFVLQVQAREQVQHKPGVQDTPFGMLVRAPDTVVAAEGGAAGGLYGGRGGQAKPADAAGLQALELAVAWLLRQQLPDGSFPDQHAQGDVEGTALVSLVLLSRGRTLDGGTNGDPLRRSIGWLLARQHDDGRFADFGPNSTRHHALATFALTEAAGLSARGPLFQPCAQLALDWLFTQRRDDGGWNDGTPGAASDPLSTAAAMMAVGSATFFRLRAQATTKELIVWFDAHRSTTPTHAGAELFCRFFAGQSPQTAPLGALADVVVTADPSDPTACHWATYALFQMGGQHWQQWTDRFAADVVARQETKGPDAGSWPAGGPSRLAATARFTWSLAAWQRYSRIVSR